MDRRNVTCGRCGQAFVAKSTGRLPTRCPECAIKYRNVNSAERQARYRAKNLARIREADRLYKAADRQTPGYTERRREGWLRRKFGLTPETYTAMLDSQGGTCAICKNGHCGTGEFFHIDHCHTTGRIRGLLCGKCNTAVGLLDDSPERAEQLAAYLRR